MMCLRHDVPTCGGHDKGHGFEMIVSSKSQFIEQLKVENGKLKFNKISVYRAVRNPHKPLALPLGELSAKLTERAVGIFNFVPIS